MHIDLADDYHEVRGFGQPVTTEMARAMVGKYFREVKDGQNLIKEIIEDTTGKYEQLKQDPKFISLQRFLHPDNHIISGVFGKEIILQLLAKRNCEGIRYVFGKDTIKNKDGTNREIMTIILSAVGQSSDNLVENK